MSIGVDRLRIRKINNVWWQVDERMGGDWYYYISGWEWQEVLDLANERIVFLQSERFANRRAYREMMTDLKRKILRGAGCE